MMKKQLHIAILFVLLPCIAQGQEISRSDLNSGGGEIVAEDIRCSYTIGGLAASTFENDKMLSQGFQQYYNILIEKSNAYSWASLKTRVFPNPAVDVVHVMVRGDREYELCTLQMVSADGKIVFPPMECTYFDAGQNFSLNLSGLSEGTYIINIIKKSDNTSISQFKLLKLK